MTSKQKRKGDNWMIRLATQYVNSSAGLIAFIGSV